VVDTPLPGLMIDIKVLQIVVKVDATRAEIPSQQSSVGCENGSDVDVTLPAERDSETGLPFMEMSDDGGGKVTSGELSEM
jgi:hypothetical protein